MEFIKFASNRNRTSLSSNCPTIHTTGQYSGWMYTMARGNACLLQGIVKCCQGQGTVLGG